MKVTVLEACRSPEVPKDTEALMLADVFAQAGVCYKLYSNDHVWPDRVTLDQELIRRAIEEPDSDIIHLAMHGDLHKLVLQWSQEDDFQQRMPVLCLERQDILGMPGWKGKRVFSGACRSASVAGSFLAAGASCVIAPTEPIPRARLGAFFSLFYRALAEGVGEADALARVLSRFPEYSSYRLYTRDNPPGAE